MITAEHLENRRKWVAALRSGEYRQGFGALRMKSESGSERFCCLGVACEVLGLRRTGTSGYENEGGDLPTRAADLLGFRNSSPMFTRETDWSTFEESLIQANDNLRLSFEEIAGIVEAQPDTWDGTLSTSVAVRAEREA